MPKQRHPLSDRIPNTRAGPEALSFCNGPAENFEPKALRKQLNRLGANKQTQPTQQQTQKNNA